MRGSFPKDAVTRVFEGLGPERVARAVAHPKLHPGGWDACFLACAYGDVNALSDEMAAEALRRVVEDGHGSPFPDERDAARVLGLTPGDTETFVVAFDEPVDRPQLMALATEWLEQNRNPRNASPSFSGSLEGATP